MKRRITVTGVSRVSARPDLAEVTMTTESAHREYRVCVEQGECKSDQLRKALAPLGFPEETLRTEDYQISPQYEGRQEDGVYKQVFVGYTCIHRMRIRFDLDRERLGRVIDAVSCCGADAALGIRFTVKDPAPLLDAGLTEAVQSAERKARLLCRAAGSELGELVEIRYQPNLPELYSPTSFSPAVPRMLAKAESLQMDVNPEDVQFSESATLTWAVK